MDKVVFRKGKIFMSSLVNLYNKNIIAFINDAKQGDEILVVGIGCISDKKKMKALIATNKRLVLYNKGGFFSGPTSYVSIGYDKISSIEVENKTFSTRGFQLTAHTSGNDISVHCIEKFGVDADGGKTKSHLYQKAIIAAIEKFNSSDCKAPQNQIDLAGQIEKLSKLYASGALSDDEFATAKRKLLR